MTPSAARQMGRYEMLFRIASGGMAEVWAARVRGEAGFQKLVAIKRMLPNLAEDEDFVAMFLDEARVAANITSPNVVQTLDLGRDDEGALYIVMELVVGVTLGRVLKAATQARRVVPVGMAAEMLAQSAYGLHDAHEASTPLGEHLEIVHRDISPQNILLGVDGRVRITDFGVAKAIMRITQTDAGRIKGKFAYCSPEQLTEPNLDRRSDVFSLGIVAWETLCGQRLFSADHPLETMKRVQDMPIPAVSQVRSRIPQKLSDVVAWALERDVEKRPPTAIAFGDALRDAAREAGSLPDARDLSTFVKAAGGKSLAKMRKNIQETLTSGAMPYVTDSQEAQLPTPSVSSVVSRSGGTGNSAAGVIGLLEERSETRPGDASQAQLEEDAPTVARVSGSLVAEFAPAPPAKRRFAMIAGAILLLMVGIGAGVALFGRPASTRAIGPTTAVPATASAQSAATPAPSAVTSTPVEPAPVPAQPAATEPTATKRSGNRRPRRGGWTRNRPVRAEVMTPIVMTPSAVAPTMTPRMTSATMTSATMTSATMTSATMTSATMTPATMTPATMTPGMRGTQMSHRPTGLAPLDF